MPPDNQYPITEAQFKTWLEQNKDAAVGMSRVNQGCPIYQCVWELTGVCPERADMGWLFMPRSERGIPHPIWVTRFMVCLDSRYHTANSQGIAVTGGEALTCLTEASR